MFRKMVWIFAFAGLAACSPQDGATGPQGPQGDPGDPGVAGEAGSPGTSADPVTVTELEVGDVNCPNGGTAIGQGEDTSFACNGAGATATEEDLPFPVQWGGTGGFQFETFESIWFGVEIDDATGRPGATKYANLVLKRGLVEDSAALLDIHQGSQASPVDALIVINAMNSTPVLEFATTRGTLPDLQIQADATGGRIASATLVLDSAVLVSSTPPVRDGDGRVRIRQADGSVWGTFDSVTMGGQAGRQHRPFTAIKPMKSASPDHWNDVLDVFQNGPTPAPMTIELLDAAGTVTQTFVAADAWPAQIVLRPSPTGLVEEVRLTASSITSP